MKKKMNLANFIFLDISILFLCCIEGVIIYSFKKNNITFINKKGVFYEQEKIFCIYATVWADGI